MVKAFAKVVHRSTMAWIASMAPGQKASMISAYIPVFFSASSAFDLQSLDGSADRKVPEMGGICGS
jgi:hypothetical protein